LGRWQAADKCLSEFLREIKASAASAELGAMVPVLVKECGAKDVSEASPLRTYRLTYLPTYLPTHGLAA
jgi:hypothetical protein